MNNWRLRREDLLKDNEWNTLKDYLNTKKSVGNWTAVQDHAICMFAVWTGLRRSEIANITLQDLFLYPVKPFIVVRHGKGGKYREVLISEDCRDYLANFLKIRDSNSDYLFVPQRGVKYTGNGIYRVWKTAIQSADLPNRSIHKARHYYCTKLHEITKDLKFIQEQAGHSKITTTQIYTHISNEQSDKYLKDFDKSL